jgi:hypothetical protein
VFSLSVNETVDELEVLDHPSGTLTTKCPVAVEYETNCVLSGMSPGGLLSAGSAFSVGAGLSGGDPDGVACPGEGETDGGLAPGDEDPLHAVSSATIVPRAATARTPLRAVGPTDSFRMCIHLVYLLAGERTMRTEGWPATLIVVS